MHSRSARAGGAAALAVAAALGCGCVALGRGAPAPGPAETFRAALGRNPGLNSLRAVTEARFRYAGREVSLPGVITLDGLGGFRLELLDPLDRPLALLYAETGRVVQYRPAQRLAASLGVFREECRGLSPADWVAGPLSSSGGPLAGEGLRVRSLWGGDVSLERLRDGVLRQSVRLRRDGSGMTPWLFSWYCGEEPVMRLRLRDWVEAGRWRVPTRLVVEYQSAGFEVSLELREIEGNPPRTGRPLLPRPGDDTRWTSWRLPE